MANQFFPRFFLAILAISCLSIGFPREGHRKLASCEAQAPASTLSLPAGLFGEIQDQALKKNALDYYLFLSKVEADALASRQSIWAMYGLKDDAYSLAFPSPMIGFDPKAPVFAQGNWWGGLLGTPASSFLVPASNSGTYLPSLTIPPYSSGLALVSGNGVTAGPPLATSPAPSGSVLKGMAIPALSNGQPQIGTY